MDGGKIPNCQTTPSVVCGSGSNASSISVGVGVSCLNFFISGYCVPTVITAVPDDQGNCSDLIYITDPSPETQIYKTLPWQSRNQWDALRVNLGMDPNFTVT